MVSFPALVLTAFGLIPFIGLTALLVLGRGDLFTPFGWPASAPLLIGYAALILSFLGGVRWGLALGQENEAKARRDYALSVVPSLLGWLCLTLKEPVALTTLSGLMLALALLDYGLTCRNDAPHWYGQMRLAAGFVACLCLLTASFFV